MEGGGESLEDDHVGGMTGLDREKANVALSTNYCSGTRQHNNQQHTMRWLFSFLLLWLSAIVSALSATGNRVLVVLEEATEKDKYSSFWGDLESMFLSTSS